MDKTILLGMDKAELGAFVAGLGQKPYRARQLYHHFYRRGCFDAEAMTDMSRAFRETLRECADFGLPGTLAVQASIDGARKYLFELRDGLRVESVFIPEDARTTLCLSTQAGCAMGCRFCATAGMGFLRNLSAGEILGQFYGVLGERGLVGQPVNVVFMGMGEPLMNLEAVMRSFGILHDPEGGAVSRRRITVSTCGLPEGIRRLGEHPVRPKLAVSLNATTDAVRSRLMPVNRKHPIADVLKACRAYPLPAGERITFEYLLAAGVNDTVEDARRLARLLRGIRCKINLIPCNPTPGGAFGPPGEAVVAAFQDVLVGARYTAIIRKSRGRDIHGACGQLASLQDETDGGGRPRPSPGGAEGYYSPDSE
ncbi:MAG: 23S rRNA (adenine(2503)-C(2))-methyltransferase RlmN [Acidobacteria bacterium]|nr:23S rRNA (adenine(2503)-C(2))-methyltransferase RlmN [Acidobacteriota bacterium]